MIAYLCLPPALLRRALGLALCATSPLAQGEAPCTSCTCEEEMPIEMSPLPSFGTKSVGEYDLALDGDRLVVGVPNDGSGRVLFYRDRGMGWELEQELTHPDTTSFGRSVDIDGDLLAVADKEYKGAVHIFAWGGDRWTHEFEIESRHSYPFYFFGDDLSLDGERLVVRVPASVDFYHRKDGVWELEANLPAGDGSGIGKGVTIAGDRAYVPSSPLFFNFDRVHVFERREGTWVWAQAIFGETEDWLLAYAATEDRVLLWNSGPELLTTVFESTLEEFLHRDGSWQPQDRPAMPESFRTSQGVYFGRMAIDDTTLAISIPDTAMVGEDAFYAGKRTEEGWSVKRYRTASPVPLSGLFNPVVADAGRAGRIHNASLDRPATLFRTSAPVRSLGHGHPGRAGGIPSLSVAGCPSFGRPLTLEVQNGIGGAPGVLLVGPAWNDTPFLGGMLGVAPSRWLVLGHQLSGERRPGAGHASFRLATDRAPAGTRLYFQALYLDVKASHGVSMTPGLEVTLE